MEFTVLLTSYMRPELTSRAIERLIEWDNLKRLIVVIDGLRSTADAAEVYWRKKTIEEVNENAHNSKLELWIYDKNVGITEHYLRLQKRILSQDSQTIWLEEDMDLDLDSFLRLDKSRATRNEPFLLSSYSHFDHPKEDPSMIKGNLFLPMWGLVMNENFSNLVIDTWNRKNYNEKVVIDALSPILSRPGFRGRIHLKSGTGYIGQPRNKG